MTALLRASQSNFMVISSCPSCESDRYKSVGRVAKGFEITVGNTSFHQPDYTVRKCSSCSLYYKSVILNEFEREKYYRSVGFEKWKVDRSPPSEHVLMETLRKLAPGSKILDYGCSAGRLLSQLTTDYECFGVELNARAAELAAKNGIRILSTLDDDDLPKNQFDAIVLSDVFEHLQAPTNFLQNLVHLLNPRGLLVLVTGNADAAIYQKDIANNWYFRNVEHLCMLSRKTADYLAVTLRLDLMTWKEVSHGEVPAHIRVRQLLQNWLYWQFHARPEARVTRCLGLIPKLNRARNWIAEPPIYHTKDHVVAIFQRQE